LPPTVIGRTDEEQAKRFKLYSSYAINSKKKKKIQKETKAAKCDWPCAAESRLIIAGSETGKLPETLGDMFQGVFKSLGL
jgi:hypothetical protein